MIPIKTLVIGIAAVGCAALAAAIFLLTTLQAPLIPTDDAFITYRYAANLAQGHGLVYNRGEHVLGTTSPGYAGLLGLIARFTGVETLPMISRLVNIAAILIAGGCAFVLSWQMTRSILVSATLLILVVLSPASFTGVLTGMEGPVFVMLITLALLALVNHRWRTTAPFMSLLPIVRPEGVFVIGLAGVIFLICLRRGQILIARRTLVESMLLLLVPAMSWAAFSTYYYGSPIPHSIIAKQAGVYPIGLLGSTVATLNGLAENYLNLSFISAISPSNAIIVGLFVTTFLFAVIQSFRWLVGRQPFLALIPAFALVMIGFYALSGTVVYAYYHPNYDIFARIAWCIGLYVIAGAVAARFLNPEAIRRYSAVLGTVAILISLFPTFARLSPVLLQPAAEPQYNGESLRQLLYRELAQHIKPFLPAGTVILMPEIGELGFILDQVKVLDAAGLVSPEAIPYLPIPPEQRAGLGVSAIPRGLLRDYRPDMLIFLDVFAVNGIAADPVFWDEYTPVIVHAVDLPGWGSNALYVVSRNDFQPGLQLPAFTSTIR
jgi:hypothetical protein